MSRIPHQPETRDDGQGGANESLEAVRATAEYLLKVPNASSRLLYVGHALLAFTEGQYNSVDQALGLRAPRGKHKRPQNEAHIEMITTAVRDLFKGKSFRAIAQLNGYDEKEFRRLYKRHLKEAVKPIADNLEPL